MSHILAPYNRMVEQLSLLHDDEDGLEAIQVVMIVAIAALVLIAFATMGKTIVEWAKTTIEKLTGINFG